MMPVLLQMLAIVLLTAEEGLALQLPPIVETDVATIRTMSTVSDGHDGFAGATPESVHAFRKDIKLRACVEVECWQTICGGYSLTR